MILKKKIIEPRYWAIIFYKDGMYKVGRTVAFTLDEAEKDIREDKSFSDYFVWWYWSESLDSIQNKFQRFKQ